MLGQRLDPSADERRQDGFVGPGSVLEWRPGRHLFRDQREDALEDLVLAGKVEVDRALGDAGRGGDLANRRPVVALAAEYLMGRLQNLASPFFGSLFARRLAQPHHDGSSGTYPISR